MIHSDVIATYIAIHSDSRYPQSQRIAAYNGMIHRLITILLEPHDYREDLNIINHIPVKRGYKSSIVDKLGNTETNSKNLKSRK